MTGGDRGTLKERDFIVHGQNETVTDIIQTQNIYFYHSLFTKDKGFLLYFNIFA